jgi:hypothetical protein
MYFEGPVVVGIGADRNLVCVRWNIAYCKQFYYF